MQDDKELSAQRIGMIFPAKKILSTNGGWMLVLATLQIIGVVLILAASFLPKFVWGIIAITGLAAVVKIFIPNKIRMSQLERGFHIFSAICGLGIFLFSLVHLFLI